MNEMNVGEDTGFENMQIILIIVIMVFIAGYIFSTYAIGYINNNWNEYRCQPLYMMIAGLIGHDPDENHKYCQALLASTYSEDTTVKMEQKESLFKKALESIQESGNEIVNKLDTMSGVHNEATSGIVKVINNFKAVIMFMMEKLKVIIKKLLAIATVIIYTLFSTVIFMKSMMGGTLGALDDIICFAKNTMIDGTPIQDIKIGGNILATMEFNYNKDYIYEYKGVKVTEDHYILEDKWKKVKDSKLAKKIPFSDDKVYCLVTKNNRIVIDNAIFSDFISINGYANGVIRNSILMSMDSNSLSDIDLDNYYESGILDTQIVTTDKGMKQVGELKLNDMLFQYGKVTGVVRQYNKKWISIKNTFTTSEQIVLYNNVFIKAKDHPYAISHTFPGIAVSINTESGLYMHSGMPILQYSEVPNDNIENLTLKLLNNGISAH
jgi:hypothetical protein